MQTIKLYDEVNYQGEVWEVVEIEACGDEDIPFVILSREVSYGNYDREYVNHNTIVWNSKLQRWQA